MKDRIAAIFSNLDSWRHLPNYQLERRTDIFFSIYLKSLVEEYTGAELLDVLIPELPIKVHGSGRSFKVDYVLFSIDRKVAYFIELKTDSSSRRDEQDLYLLEAARAGLQTVLNDLKEIVGKTVSYRKYCHLLHWLAKAEVISLPTDLRGYLYPSVKPRLRTCLGKIEVLAKDVKIQVIYVQPTKTSTELGRSAEEETCIDFQFIIRHLNRFEDEFSKMFAAHLERWKQTAGDVEPDGWK